MVHVEQAIVVEGRYDKNTLSQIVDTVIFQTNGFSVMHDRELLALLRRAAQTCGLVILTDSDGAGLSGGAGSAGKRQALLQDLGLPGYLSANALVDALNLRMTREELYARYGETQ